MSDETFGEESSESHRLIDRRNIVKTAGLLAISGLAGCSSAGSSSEGTETGSATKNSSISLEIWREGQSQELDPTMSNIAEEYNNTNNGASVDISLQGAFSDLLTKNLNALNAGNPPHVTWANAGQILELKNTGKMRPVSDILSSSEIEKITPVLRNYLTRNGDSWYVPYEGINQAILFYNADAFNEAGLDPDNPPKTLSEVTEASQAIVDNTDIEYGVGFPSDPWIPHFWYSLEDELYFNNGNGHDGHPTEYLITKDIGMKMWEWIRMMGEEELRLVSGPMDWDTHRRGLLNKKVAMTMGVSHWSGSLKEADFDGRTGVLPSLTDERYGTIAPQGGAWVPKQPTKPTDVQDAVADFLKLLISEEHQMNQVREKGVVPVTEEAINKVKSSGYLEDNPMLEAALTQVDNTEASPATNRALVGPNQFYKDTAAQMISSIHETSDLQKQVKSTKEKIDERLQQFIGENK